MRRKTLVVPLCGFDSVPSDVGCRMVVDHVRQRLRAEVCEVDGLFALGGGGASRGTLNSMVGVVSDASALRAMRAPFALNPPDKVPEPSERAPRARAGRRLCADPARAPARRVPRRAARPRPRLHRPGAGRGRLGRAVPDGGRQHAMRSPQQRARRLRAALLVQRGAAPARRRARIRGVALHAAPRRADAAAARAPPAFALLPAARRGALGGRAAPRALARHHGRRHRRRPPRGRPPRVRRGVRVHCVGGSRVRRVRRVRVGTTLAAHAPRPSLSQSVVESAVCLARRRASPLEMEGGVATPAAAMGPQLLERLRRAGVQVEVEQLP